MVLIITVNLLATFNLSFIARPDQSLSYASFKIKPALKLNHLMVAN